MSRTLLLMRHAKSDYPSGVADHDRPLATRGVREAGLAGDWLRGREATVDAVLCSTARRTRDTLQRTGIEADTHFVARLYDATAATVLDEIREADATFGRDVRTLLVIGHQPAVSQVALSLAALETSDDDAIVRITTKFPTSAIAVLTFDGTWDALSPGGATLTHVEVPR